MLVNISHVDAFVSLAFNQLVVDWWFGHGIVDGILLGHFFDRVNMVPNTHRRVISRYRIEFDLGLATDPAYP